MVSLLEIASPCLLLVPGFFPLLFFAHSRLVGSPPPAKPAHVICLLVFFLGPLAAVAAALRLVVLTFSPQSQSIQVAQDITQSFVEFGYRGSILYLITPSSFAVIASHVSLSQKEICRHNAVLAVILFATFILSVIKAALAPSVIPTLGPFASGILAALFPIPLIIHLILSAQSERVRRIWGFISLLQTFSALAMALHIPQGPAYVFGSALFTVLWGGGVLTLFYTLSSVPLLPSTPQQLRPPKFSSLSSVSTTATPARVQYETPQACQVSGAIISEDFTALRDPFASPPPVSPVSIITPVPRFPGPIPTSAARIILSPPLTPTSKLHKPPKPRAKEIKAQRRGIIKQTSSIGIGKRSSSQSLQPLSSEMPPEESWRASENGSENALFLNDEALLSQILLHSLIRDAVPSPCPQSLSERRDEGSSIYSEISITTIRTRRDENGRRYGSEEVRNYNSATTQEIEESNSTNYHCDDQVLDNSQELAQIAVTSQESSGVEHFELQSRAKEGGDDTAWWARP